MILITDSGSTKCDWIALDNNGEQLFKVKTGGMNPAILTIEELPLRILESEELVAHKDQVEQLFFYGAGCGTEKPRLALENLLKNYFSNAQVTVKEDTAAAVYAAVGDEPGIVCILGTGSNCCFSDGDTIEQRVVSLGYTLMDEASGNWYGKNLLRDYGFKNMPSDLM
ncbi:BadF/BadG/BcrA/BcrD ATPase family protein, partial [Nonlabens ulvanivorans]